MSKYNKFEDFMQAVINESDRKCRSRYSKSLADAYKVNMTTVTAVLKIIDSGWWVFAALVAILVLGPLGFGAALLGFVSTPAGMIVVGVLAAGGGIAAIRTIYKNRVLPIAVKKTGEMYKSEFEQHMNETSYIERLIDRASDTLISKSVG